MKSLLRKKLTFFVFVRQLSQIFDTLSLSFVILRTALSFISPTIKTKSSRPVRQRLTGGSWKGTTLCTGSQPRRLRRRRSGLNASSRWHVRRGCAFSGEGSTSQICTVPTVECTARPLGGSRLRSSKAESD